jgi:AcrR family transcriptional regulator
VRVRTEAKRSDILHTAAVAFLEQGFERTSMSEIAARVGGSKATLYGYFGSKEELFVAVVVAEAEKQLIPAFAELDEHVNNLREALLGLGEKLLTFLLSPDSIAAHRMVLSEAGESDIGHRFHANGRQRGIGLLADFFERARRAGKMRRCDFRLAATHLCALMESELLPPILFGVPRTAPSRREIRLSAERGVDAFLAAYGT